MRSPISLGIVFLVFAAFSVVGIPGAHLGPVAYGLVGVLGLAGGLVMTGLGAAYYVGLVAGLLTILIGGIDWSHAFHTRIGLPFHPGLEVGMGVYLCVRMFLAQRMFGPKKVIGTRPS